ncbi:MAG: adenylyltransferase/cytidyltransferase family protein [Patescibacteria group bacterium]
MTERNELEQACHLVRQVGLGNVLAELAPRRKSPKELTVEEAVQKIAEVRGQGQTVAFASGCFDILHIGHVLFFGGCKKEVGLLFVGVDSNKNVGGAKGSDHPMFDETERLLVVASLEVVDFVMLFNGSCATLLEKLRPDFYCFSPFDPKYEVKAKDAMRAGAQVKEAGYSLKAWSSSRTAGVIRHSFLFPGDWENGLP